VLSMSLEDIIQRILSSHPNLSREEVLKMIQQKEETAKGFLTRESAARALAAELGVEPLGKPSKRRLALRDLVSGLGDVTVTARVLFVSPIQTFTRSDETEGKLRRLFIADQTGELRVVLWDDKAEMLQAEKLVGKIARFSHGYVRRGFNGRLELNIGSRGTVEVDPPDVCEDDLPPFTSFLKKINGITLENGTVNVVGIIEEAYPVTTFNRKDGSEGKVRRLRLKDDTGEIMVVLWNKRVDALSGIKSGTYLQVFRGKVRESLNGKVELHVDSSVDAMVLNENPLNLDQAHKKH